MELTLTADEALIERAREYAREHGTTLDELVVEFLSGLRVWTQEEREAAAEEFVRLARATASVPEDAGQVAREAAVAELRRIWREHPGNPDPDWRWNREECHERGAGGPT
ncbi:MAG: hypothetical protein HYU66_01525 [Armatimonadetes bacterium]|nr:hypothetical protein [Armatimonadota bacterium]